MKQDKKQADQLTVDLMAGLDEINKLGSGATVFDVACAMLKHISPHVKSVKFEGSRKISVPNAERAVPQGARNERANGDSLHCLGLPPLKDLFPFEYQGGGYFRKRGVPKGESADILHGEQAGQFLYDEVKRHNAEHEPRAVASRAPCSCSASGDKA